MNKPPFVNVNSVRCNIVLDERRDLADLFFDDTRDDLQLY